MTIIWSVAVAVSLLISIIGWVLVIYGSTSLTHNHRLILILCVLFGLIALLIHILIILNMQDHTLWRW